MASDCPYGFAFPGDEQEPLQFTLKYQKLMSSLAYPAKLDIFNETRSLLKNVI